LWKVGVFFFVMTLTFEVVITIIFWTALYSPPSPDESTFNKAKGAMDHSMPLLMLLIDFFLNAMIINPYQIIWTILIMVAYGLENLIIVLGTGFIIYPILEWDSISSLWVTIGITILTVFSYVLFYYLAVYKDKYFNKRRVETKVD
jgi:hypothetical protein